MSLEYGMSCVQAERLSCNFCRRIEYIFTRFYFFCKAKHIFLLSYNKNSAGLGMEVCTNV